MIENGRCNLSEESLSTCRVDKKGALQTETGSKGVSCRSLLEGTSQGSCFASGSVSTRGSQKKNIKTKVDMEKPRESLVSVSPCWLEKCLVLRCSGKVGREGNRNLRKDCFLISFSLHPFFLFQPPSLSSLFSSFALCAFVCEHGCPGAYMCGDQRTTCNVHPPLPP